MTQYDYDLVVIGSGPAGQRAAIQASKLRKRVAIVGSGEAVVDAQFQNGQFFGVDRDRQLQVGRHGRRRVARGGDDVQGGDAQFGDVQRAAKQGGWRPVEMNLRRFDLQRGALPAQLADVHAAEQAAAGLIDLQLAGTGALGQFDRGLQTAFAARQPAKAADDGGAGEEGEKGEGTFHFTGA